MKFHKIFLVIITVFLLYSTISARSYDEDIFGISVPLEKNSTISFFEKILGAQMGLFGLLVLVEGIFLWCDLPMNTRENMELSLRHLLSKKEIEKIKLSKKIKAIERLLISLVPFTFSYLFFTQGLFSDRV